MRRHLQILTILAALATACGTAQALDAAKVASIDKAADSFVALAKNAAKTGKAPRASDSAAKPLLDTIFNTKEIEGGKPRPWSEILMLHDWNKAAMKVGLVYYLAGTGTDDVAVVAKDPKLTEKANENTITYAAEFGRYYDAQLHLYLAMVEAASAKLTNVTPKEKQDPKFIAILNSISDGTAKTMIGLLHSLVLPGMPDDWLLLRTVMLLDLTPKAAKFMAPEDRKLVRNAAVEAANQIKNPDVKSGVNTVARAFEML